MNEQMDMLFLAINVNKDRYCFSQKQTYRYEDDLDNNPYHRAHKQIIAEGTMRTSSTTTC